nr:thiamine phosphate phosphatase-like protein [Tanacetum cinerariifolium]
MDDDSDRWVVVQMGLIHLFNLLRQTLPWNSLMGRVVKQIQDSTSEVVKKQVIIYIGDGGGDFCMILT